MLATGHVMFVEMRATRSMTARRRMDVGGGARIMIVRGMCLSGMGAFLDLTASWS